MDLPERLLPRVGILSVWSPPNICWCENNHLSFVFCLVFLGNSSPCDNADPAESKFYLNSHIEVTCWTLFALVTELVDNRIIQK